MSTTLSPARLSAQEILEDVAQVVLIDDSGSMDSVEGVTRSSANDFLRELQSGSPVRMSLATFGDAIRFIAKEQPVDFVKPLTPTTYRANGACTLLYDAIGEAIEHVEAMTVPPVHPVVVVFTDGMDTSSQRYSAATLKPMIELRRLLGWRFIAFVIGHNPREATEAAGFLPDDTFEYSGGPGTKAAFRKLAASMKRLTEAVATKALPPAKFLVD
jgi:uncharacterized protein YegL